jgi:hypothetical protein
MQDEFVIRQTEVMKKAATAMKNLSTQEDALFNKLIKAGAKGDNDAVLKVKYQLTQTEKGRERIRNLHS